MILRVMPIPCVDLVVENCRGEVLLVRRKNEPAKGEWWFPGGRVRFGEEREASAKRKLNEECGLSTMLKMEELWTLDAILPIQSESRVSHGITTIYAVKVQSGAQVHLDAQSSEFAWMKPAHWKAAGVHPFVYEILSRIERIHPNSSPNSTESA